MHDPPAASDEMSSPPPFEGFPVIGSERLYASPWCGLRKDRLRLPDGGVHDYHVVEISDAVAIVPVLPDGRILLVWQYRYPHGRTHWEVPAGRIQAGETPRVAAARELREETGHSPGNLQPLPGFFPINGISDHWCHLFVAHGCLEQGPPRLDTTERLLARAFPAQLVRRRLAEGAFQDGFSALALFYYLAGEGRQPASPPR